MKKLQVTVKPFREQFRSGFATWPCSLEEVFRGNALNVIHEHMK